MICLAVYCGVDIVEIERVKKSISTCGDSFIERVFTQGEVSYCESRKNARFQSYAARFAGKEAVSKAFGTGLGGGIKWRDIEIKNDEHGKPYVILQGEARNKFDSMGGKGMSISLSHCEHYAVAYAVIEAV